VIAADCLPFGIAGTIPICAEAAEAGDDDEIETTGAEVVAEIVDVERIEPDEARVDVLGAKSVNAFVGNEGSTVFVGSFPTAGTLPTMPVVLAEAVDNGAESGFVPFSSLGIL
jgi:hypothetical protein